MGLSLSVGILVELKENDQEGYDNYSAIFEAVKGALAKEGLPTHKEPTEISPKDQISYDMYGYSGLHYLRRIAAHLAYTKTVPPPGDDGSSGDSFLKRYYRESVNPPSRTGLLGLFRKPSGTPEFNFNHLIQHSDCEGFYLPLDFVPVIFPDSDLKIPGEMIGSSHRLLAECRQLAAALAIPTDIDPEGDELWEAADSQGEGSDWRRYGIEAFTCVRLIHACQASIRSSSAVVFC